MERIHHRDRIREFLGSGGLESAKFIHGNDFHTFTPLLGPIGQPALESLLGAALDHIEQPRRTGAFVHAVKSMITVDIFVLAAGVTSHVLIDTNHLHTVEAGRIVDQHPLGFGQHRVAGGVPRHRERFGDPGHRKVLAHNGFQCPPQCPA
jgi:hypothetical protein